MGEFYFIPTKKICPIEAVKILEYTRSVKACLCEYKNFTCVRGFFQHQAAVADCSMGSEEAQLMRSPKVLGNIFNLKVFKILSESVIKQTS